MEAKVHLKQALETLTGLPRPHAYLAAESIQRAIDGVANARDRLGKEFFQESP